jgi:hypothetical protein
MRRTHHLGLSTLRLFALPLALGAAGFVSTALVAAPAAAQDKPAAEKTAADLQREGRELLANGENAAACTRFERAYDLAGKPDKAGGAKPEDVLFDLAECHEKQGYASLAASEFEQVAGSSSARSADAKSRAAKLRGGASVPAASGPAETPAKPEPAPEAAPKPASAEAAAKPGEAPAKAADSAKKPESPTRVGDFMDTRLTWVFGDDDILKQTGQAFPLSPNANIGERRQYRLFFDNLNSRFAGRENLTHLALYKKMPGFVDGLDTEASMIVRLDLGALASNTGNLNRAFYDSGSYIRAFYHTQKHDDPKKVEGVGVTLWPIDADRFRLGYLYDISWGGSAVDINQSIFPRLVGPSPGAKFSYDTPKFNAFVGFKTGQIVQVEETLTPGTSEVEQIRVGETNYGLLAGVGGDLHDNFRVDAGGGFFTQGKFDLPDVEGLGIWTGGVSARVLAHHVDMPAGQSIDFALYRNDPNRPMQIFRPVKYVEDKTLWSVSLEGSSLFQRLKDFDVAGQVTVQPAIAAALQGQVQSGFLRASLAGILRDLPFVLRNQPSFIPFQTLPADAKSDPEIFIAAAADYHFPGTRLTPGIGGGLQLPSTFTSESVDLSSAPISRTVVVREQGNIAILPVNTGAAPILQARASLRWDISEILSATAWVQYVRDNNATFVERDPNEGTVALRTFVSPDFLGLAGSVQARF